MFTYYVGGNLAITMSPVATAQLLVYFFQSLIEPPIPQWAHANLIKVNQLTIFD